MNTNELERYVEIMKQDYPKIHLQTINKIYTENQSFYKKYNINE